jgi:tetratricopeptide (TPR) repeat protein
MSSFTDYTEQRLIYARDLLKSGDIQRALSICEQLLSPASIFSHGKEIFLIISDAIEKAGDFDKATLIRKRADELFPDSIDDSIAILRSPEIVIESILPFLHFKDDVLPELIEYDEINVDFPSFTLKEYPKQQIEIIRSEESQQTLSALEELAQRLEKARIPAIEEEKIISTPSFMPSIVTETMANIYVQQGAFSQAIKAYQVLARNQPERLDHFEAIIADLRLRQS